MFSPALLLCVGCLCLSTEPASAMKTRSRKKFPKPEIVPHPPPSRSCDLDEYLLFNFITAVSVEEVKHIFQYVHVLYAFKVTGKGHYYYIVENDHSRELKDLYLPGDAQATAEVIPMETMSNFLGRFGVDNFPSPKEHLPDMQLGVIKKTWHAEGLTEEQFSAMMRAFFTRLDIVQTSKEVAQYVTVGNLPFTCYIFFNGSDCELARNVLKEVDPFGTFGTLDTNVQRIHNIH